MSTHGTRAPREGFQGLTVQRSDPNDARPPPPVRPLPPGVPRPAGPGGRRPGVRRVRPRLSRARRRRGGAGGGARARRPRSRARPDSALLAAAVAEAATLPRLTGIIVSQHGRIEAERYFRGAGPDRRTNVKSASKSVLSALWVAIREGHLKGVDQPVAELLPEYFGAGTDPRKRAITVGHLLSMTAGLESTSFGNYGRWVSSRDWVRAALDRPLVAEPGGDMVYSTGSTHLLSAVLTRATGRSTYAYAREKLAEPLGIELRPWQRDPQGIYFGGNDMYLTPREMLRFGELYLNGGEHGGREVVPRAWVEESFRSRASSPWERARVRVRVVDAALRRAPGVLRVGVRRAVRVRGPGAPAGGRLHLRGRRPARPAPPPRDPRPRGPLPGPRRLRPAPRPRPSRCRSRPTCAPPVSLHFFGLGGGFRSLFLSTLTSLRM